MYEALRLYLEELIRGNREIDALRREPYTQEKVKLLLQNLALQTMIYHQNILNIVTAYQSDPAYAQNPEIQKISETLINLASNPTADTHTLFSSYTSPNSYYSQAAPNPQSMVATQTPIQVANFSPMSPSMLPKIQLPPSIATVQAEMTVPSAPQNNSNVFYYSTEMPKRANRDKSVEQSQSKRQKVDMDELNRLIDACKKAHQDNKAIDPMNVSIRGHQTAKALLSYIREMHRLGDFKYCMTNIVESDAGYIYELFNETDYEIWAKNEFARIDMLVFKLHMYKQIFLKVILNSLATYIKEVYSGTPNQNNLLSLMKRFGSNNQKTLAYISEAIKLKYPEKESAEMSRSKKASSAPSITEPATPSQSPLLSSSPYLSSESSYVPGSFWENSSFFEPIHSQADISQDDPTSVFNLT